MHACMHIQTHVYVHTSTHPYDTKSALSLLQYLESVRPLLDDEQYKQMETVASEFKKGPAPKLQRYLKLKSWWATNYVREVASTPHSIYVALFCVL